jgi:zinc protease
LYQTLVKQKQVALSVDGGVNWPLASPYEYNGPTLMTSFVVYPPKVTEEQVLSAYDSAVKELTEKEPSAQDVARVVAKMRSDWFDQLERPIERASVLSHAVLFDGDFNSVYQIPEDLAKITPAQVRTFAGKYLVSANRTIINRVPASSAQGSEKQEGAGQ